MILEPKKSEKNKLFEETSYQAIQAAQRKKWLFIAGFAFVATVIAVLVIKDYVSNQSQNKIASEYAAIDLQYQKETSDFQEKSQTTQNKSDKQATPDYSKSMAQFKSFALSHSNDPYGWQAAIRCATYFIAQHDLASAQSVLNAIESKTNGYPLLHFKVATTLASLYTSQKENNKALEILSSLEKTENDSNLDQVHLLKAQILFVSGKKNEAIQVLNQLISSSNTSELSADPNSTKHRAKIWLNYINSNS